MLGDAEHRVAVLGGREGMSRSLGSVYGGSVTRFLRGGGLRGVVSRVIDTPGVHSYMNGIAVTRDGGTLLVSADNTGVSRAIHEFSVADGSRRRVIGVKGTGPLQFRHPRQVYIAADGFVFVADGFNNRVQVLTPSLHFHAFVGVGQLSWPSGVCANADAVVVSEIGDIRRISVFNRHDGTLLRRFGYAGDSDCVTEWPCGLCFMSGDRHVAVADETSNRVSVFSIDGDFILYFIRHVGVGVLDRPFGVACSPFDELVVADYGNRRVAVFSAAGELAMTIGDGGFMGVAVHGSNVFAHEHDSQQCVVFR